MQVYKITPTTEYSYGCALVAADSKEQAIKTFKEDSEFNDVQYDDLKCVCNIVDKLHYYCEESTLIIDTVSDS